MIVAEASPTRRLLHVAGGVLLAGLALAIGYASAPFAYDDAWITYRYALNFASGDGLVYNAGERVFGTSAPGYALLLGVLALPDPEAVPVLSGMLCTLALAAGGLAFYVYGVRRGAVLAGVVAAMLFVVNPLALESFGGEMLPQAALAAWALCGVVLDRPAIAIACGTAATILRPDGAIVLAVAVGVQAWRTRRLPWRPLVVAALVLAVWFGTLWLYFGSPLPSTLAAKQAQRASGAWRAFGTDLVLWLLALTPYDTPFTTPRTHSGFATFLTLGLSGLAVLPWRRGWWGLAIWPIATLLVYRQLRLPFYHWYAVTPLVLLTIGAGLASDTVARVLGGAAERWWPRPHARLPARAVAAVVVAVMVAVVAVRPLAAVAAGTRAWFPGPGERAYIAIGRWLAAHTPPDASVGYIEVGFVGYFSRRRMVDPFGLVTPEAAGGVARGDFLHAYRTRRPDVILHSSVFFPTQMGHLEREPWFHGAYRAVATLDSGRGYPLTVWRRIAAR
jgi:hypothetical protein